ncbi:hypothetical protein NJH83_21645 [Pseudomonas chlororaphis]|uniref:MrpH family fimbial adhesin n=1 Tax=Pseudomonas chlororaphis TaxID=587753 RepID=UPI00209ADEF7|nr:hypothetical protein [Pseudomonas chlororaphis]MCO7612840.1 hypothetical protein [Pseudomonas chlororaphis]
MLEIFVRLIWLGFVFITSYSAIAVEIESTGSTNANGGVYYFFTVTQWEGGGDDFCRDLSARTCNLTIVGISTAGAYEKSHYYWYNLRPNSTMTDLRISMSNSIGVGSTSFGIPFRGSIFVPGPFRNLCISFVQQLDYGGGILTRYNPVGPCRSTMEPAAMCEINGYPIIDHGRISNDIDTLNLSSAETTLRLTCTGKGTVTASASKESPTGIKLRDDGSLYSKITIDGKPAAAGVRINVEKGYATPITIKSQLYSNGVVKPGVFSGSTVLTIAPP